MPTLRLDPVAGIGIGVVDHLVLVDERVGHDDHAVVSGSNTRGAQPDLHHVAPGALALDLDAVADAKGPVNEDDEPGDGVGDGVPRRQGKGQSRRGPAQRPGR